MMDDELPFDYRAVWPDEYAKSNKSNKVKFNRMHLIRKDKIAFNEHKFKPNEFPLTQKDVQLYSVEKERLQELLEIYPKAEEVFEEYAVKQTQYLRQVRLKAKHLVNTPSREFDFTYNGRRKPVYLNVKADRDDLDFKIMQKKESTQEERIAELVLKVNQKMSTL